MWRKLGHHSSMGTGGGGFFWNQQQFTLNPQNIFTILRNMLLTQACKGKQCDEPKKGQILSFWYLIESTAMGPPREKKNKKITVTKKKNYKTVQI